MKKESARTADAGRRLRTAARRPLWKRAAALVLAAACILTSMPPIRQTAEASVGTTDYEKVFKIRQTGGSPASYDGNGIFTLARTDSEESVYWRKDAYNNPGGYTSDSWGSIQSKNAISLLNDWSFSGTFYGRPKASSDSWCNYDMGFALNGEDTPTDSTPYYWFYWTLMDGEDTIGGQKSGHVSRLHDFGDGYDEDYDDGQTERPVVNTIDLTADAYVLNLSYDSANDELTLTIRPKNKIESATKSAKNIRGRIGNKVYLSLWTQIEWLKGKTKPDGRVTATFDSFSYPDFEPAIQDLTLYKDGTNEVVGADDTVAPGTVLRVESTVKNLAADAAGQQFELHLKNSDNKDYPTQGLEFVADAAHPTTVAGISVATSKNGYTVDGQYGVPVKLVGNAETKVVYYIKVTEESGGAVKLGQMLEDDVFYNCDYTGATLINERPLEPFDPDSPDAGDLTPGSDYHYARQPAPNANGWNNSNVALQFYAGDFQQFTIAEEGGTTKTLAGGQSHQWQGEQQTSKLTYQAQNANDGSVSVKVSDKIKIDVTPPAALVLADGSIQMLDNGGSGLWRVLKKESDGSLQPVETFALTGTLGDQSGPGSQSYTPAKNGIYVVEDAAGNRSLELSVQVTDPPVVQRPDVPGTPVGPEYDPDDDPVPTPSTEIDPDTGLVHAKIEESIVELVQDPPLYGGSFDRTVVDGMLAYRYAVPTGSTAQVAVKDKEGTDITAQGRYLDTTKPGGVDIFYTLTDGDGNTTQIILHYRLVKARPPQVDPADPDAPLPGPEVEPIDPDDPEGPVKAVYKDSLTELIRESGVMDKAAAQALMEERYHFTYPDAASQSVQVELEDRNGDPIEEIDLTRVGDYLIRYTATDANGNQTAVELSYHLISRVPPVIVPPEDGELVGPTPADPDDPLIPLPDGEGPDSEKPSALLYEDEYTEYIKDSVLDQAAALSWMEERYGASSPVGAALTGSVSLYDSKGDPVEQIDQSRVGDYVLIYTVTDQDGNRVSVKLKYHLISKTPPAVVPSDPEHPLPDPIPLPDPVPGSQKKHWNIRDHLEEVRSGSWSKADILQWMAQQYTVSSNQADGSLTYDLLLFDQDGRPAEEIDLSRPGSCTFYYTATDSVGNTTTVQLTYKLTDRQITGPVGPADSDGADGSGGAPNGGGNAPYTGLLGGRGVGNCWVHWLALLLMATVALYTIRRRRRTGADAERVGDERPGLLGRDLFFYSLVSALAALLYLLRGCALDGIALLAVAAAVVASAIAVSRRKAEEESEH